MTRPFWTRPNQPEPDTCETLDSLLSLYADGMASPGEALRVEGHLSSCPACTDSLLWIRATHRALASRPPVLPPPDLRARIARAIAEADAAPPLLRPARVFTLRPAYAAAASLSVVAAAVGLSLLHTQPPAHVAPIGPSHVAAIPRTAPPLPMKTATPKAVVKTAPAHDLVAQAKLHHTTVTERVASKGPEDEPETPGRELTPAAPPVHVETTPPKANAVENTPIRVRPRVLPRKKPTSPRASTALMASNHVPARSVEDRVPKTDSLETKHTDTSVASRDVPAAHTPNQVETPAITNDSPPVVRTASADLMGSVRAYVHVHSTGFEHDLSLAGRTAVRTAVRNGGFAAVSPTDGGEIKTVTADLR